MSGSDSPTFFHGQPWSNWIEKIGRDKPLSDEEPESEPPSSVMRLSVDDIDLYGFCPERDTFYGVVCEICNSIVKPQALIQHMETRHPSGNSSLPPPPNSTTKSVAKTPYCKLSKLKKSQSSGQLSINATNNNTSSKSSNNHTPIKQRSAEQQSNNLHSSFSSSSPRSPLESSASSSSFSCVQSSNSFTNTLGGSGGSPVKSPGGQPKRKRLKTERSLLKDREYDPDRHCGVWNEETGKPCTRSLTCKAHTVSLRRTVSGRSKTFDKLLAEHRAAKEIPNTRTTCKIIGTNVINATASITGTTLSGTISIAGTELSTTAAMAPSTPVAVVASSITAAIPAPAAATDLETPSSPPVLSLPDTYPLPQAVDLLYRCLAPHGSNKPTKLEEDFANELESNRRIESSVVNNNSNSAVITGNSNSSVTTSSSSMAPISVVLPSLSPIPTGNLSPQGSLLQYSRTVSTSSPINMEQIINKQSPVSTPAPAVLSVNNQTPQTTVAQEVKTTPMDIDSQNLTMFTSPVFNDSGKSQVTVQITRSNIMSQSPVSRNYSNIFDSSLDDNNSTETMRTTSHSMTNGKRIGNHHHSSMQTHIGRIKHEFPHDYSTSIQLEATTASTPYTSFNDISWSNCHPEPLAVSRWLRITSSRKQYNFNIH